MYKPGVIVGGKVYHDCGNSRAVGYFLEPLIALGPFSKSPMNVTLNGITNDNVDISVSLFVLFSEKDGVSRHMQGNYGQLKAAGKGWREEQGEVE